MCQVAEMDHGNAAFDLESNPKMARYDSSYGESDESSDSQRHDSSRTNARDSSPSDSICGGQNNGSLHQGMPCLDQLTADDQPKSEPISRPSSSHEVTTATIQHQDLVESEMHGLDCESRSSNLCFESDMQRGQQAMDGDSKEWIHNGFSNIHDVSGLPVKVDAMSSYHAELANLTSGPQSLSTSPCVWLTGPTSLHSMPPLTSPPPNHQPGTTATTVIKPEDVIGAVQPIGSINSSMEAHSLSQQLVSASNVCDAASAAAAAASLTCGLPKLNQSNHMSGQPMLSLSPKISSRHNDETKVNIPKICTPYGFRYVLESPSSSSARKDEDRITYVNKGQFYAVTLEYVPEHGRVLQSTMVKSVIMVVFREGKTEEEELEAWKFWHTRQHSMKHRIIDIDMKNSAGLLHCVEEVAHNAIAIYWNPIDGCAKATITIQCLSTDFSTQKGVKGLPLHLQIDTYENFRDGPYNPPDHRGYAQVKIFCDKGAERKARDEERRATKRRMTSTGKRRLDDLYHQMCERSEFYNMKNVHRRAVLFIPHESMDQVNGMDYGSHHDVYGINESSVQFPVAQQHQSQSSPIELATVALSPAIAAASAATSVVTSVSTDQGIGYSPDSLADRSVNPSAIRICSSVADVSGSMVPVSGSTLSPSTHSSASVQYYNQPSQSSSNGSGSSGSASTISFDHNGAQIVTTPSIIDSGGNIMLDKDSTGVIGMTSTDASLCDLPYNLAYYDKDVLNRPTDLSQHSIETSGFFQRLYEKSVVSSDPSTVDNVTSLCLAQSPAEGRLNTSVPSGTSPSMFRASSLSSSSLPLNAGQSSSEDINDMTADPMFGADDDCQPKSTLNTNTSSPVKNSNMSPTTNHCLPGQSEFRLRDHQLSSPQSSCTSPSKPNTSTSSTSTTSTSGIPTFCSVPQRQAVDSLADDENSNTGYYNLMSIGPHGISSAATVSSSSSNINNNNNDSNPDNVLEDDTIKRMLTENSARTTLPAALAQNSAGLIHQFAPSRRPGQNDSLVYEDVGGQQHAAAFVTDNAHFHGPSQNMQERSQMSVIRKNLPHREDRVMIFVRQDPDSAYTALHLVPPNVSGLIAAIQAKYQINPNNIRYLYRKNKAGVVAKIDDDMLKFYCNEDVFLMQVMVNRDSSGQCQDGHIYDITLVESET